MADTKAGPYPFADKERQYKRYTAGQLHYALLDAIAAERCFRGEPAELWYADDASTIANIIRKGEHRYA